MNRRREELERALEAAKKIRETMRSPSKRLDVLIERASGYLLVDAPYFDAACGALLQICGWMMNDKSPEIRRGPNHGENGKSQYMVANTKNHAQLFAFAETKEGAVCAYLERLTSFPDQDKVSS